MLRAMTYYSKRDDITDEKFWHEVMDVHVPMVVKLPGLRRYRQNKIVQATAADNSLSCDGIAELWFESMDDYQAAFNSPQIEAPLAHVPQILDTATMKSLMVEEHRIPLDNELAPDTPEQPLKFMFHIKRRPDVTFEEFKRHLLKIHVPIVTTYPGLRRYTLAFNIVPEEQREAGSLPFDAIAEHYYDSKAAFDAAFASDAAKAGAEDAKHFMQSDSLNSVPMLVVKEYPVALNKPAGTSSTG
jgi:uncharacterized protein (TIGR02118 family)